MPNKKKTSFNALKKLVAPEISRYTFSVSCVVLSLFTAAIIVLACGKAIKTAINNKFFSLPLVQQLPELMIVFIAIFSLAIASFVRVYFLNKIGEGIISRIQQNLFHKLNQLTIDFYDNTPPAKILQLLETQTESLKIFLTRDVGVLVRNTIIILGSVALMAYENFLFLVVSLTIICIGLIPIFLVARKTKLLKQSHNIDTQILNSHTEEMLLNMRTAKIFNHMQQNNANFYGYRLKVTHSFQKLCRTQALTATIGIISIFFILFAIFLFGQLLIHSESLDTGSFTTFIFYAVILGGTIAAMGPPLSSYIQACLCAEQYLFYMNQQTKFIGITPVNKDIKLTNHGTVAIHQVYFAYPAYPQKVILKDISLSIAPAQKIAIVGPSGCGKSTLLWLLLKLYQPQKGNIYIEGKNILSIPQENLAKHMGLVSQDNIIFSTTVFENLAYGCLQVSEADLWDALDFVDLKSFVKALPYGLHTQVGVQGIKLSGGQKQRLCLARVLLCNPSILLLDEATSALDNTTSRFIESQLYNAFSKRTVISITHRLSTVRDADKVFVMHDGKIIGNGTHQSLYKENPIYKTLVDSENLYTADKVNLRI